jgi:hypothetical protein
MSCAFCLWSSSLFRVLLETLALFLKGVDLVKHRAYYTNLRVPAGNTSWSDRQPENRQREQKENKEQGKYYTRT